ncbi:MAG: hypothetical protein Q8L15_06175 [Methylobacter sp.]|nr:hypothetical protein [Methylobacter sp.]
MFNNLISHKQVFSFAALLVLSSCASNKIQTNTDWQNVYEDNYTYSTQDPDNTTFNTWFWREDSIGTHEFEYTKSPCSPLLPCVKLTAQKHGETKKIPYINAEMYNNTCVRLGLGHPEIQAYDKLLDNPNPWFTDNPWVQPGETHTPAELHKKIGEYCGKPYPYRSGSGEPKTPYANSSWNTTTGARLYRNPFAYSLDKEARWQSYRDLAFNSLYLADDSISQKIKMHIKAEGNTGGTRGWGYWNTTMDPLTMQFAWFMEFTSLNSPANSRVWLITVKGGLGDKDGFCATPLPKQYSIYDWHDYEVVWSAASVEYYIDSQRVAKHEKFIPNVGMAFHNWVDNRNFSSKGPANYPLPIDKSNYINKYTVDEKIGVYIDNSVHAGAEKTVCSSFIPLIDKMEKKDFYEIIKAILMAYH